MAKQKLNNQQSFGYVGTVNTIARSITSTTPQTLADLGSIVTAPGKYQITGFIYVSDGGVAATSDFNGSIKVNGTSVFAFTESITATSWIHMVPIIATVDYTSGAFIIDGWRGSGSKTLTLAGSNQITVNRVA